MVSSVSLVQAFSNGVSYFTSISPWTLAVSAVSAVALPYFLKKCKKPNHAAPNPIPVIPQPAPQPLPRDLASPRNVFLQPLRPQGIPENQEVNIYTRIYETVVINVFRTAQQDLICQIFDTATKQSHRRYVGERGQYPQRGAEEFLQYRIARVVNSRNGLFSIFFFVHERMLHVWRNDQYEVTLAHNENDGKLDWVVFFIDEKRVERVAAGLEKNLRHLIPLWSRNHVVAQTDAAGIVSVTFPNVVAPNPAPVVQELVQLPADPRFQELSVQLSTFTLGSSYADNIPIITAAKNGVSTTIGYARDDGLLMFWSFTPLQDGNVVTDGATANLSLLFSRFSWRAKPPIFNGLCEDSIDQGSLQNGMRLYWSGKDAKERLYTLIPANGGWVPVRHPTDPSCGNWLSNKTLTKIIYDSHRLRWPGCEGINYRQHGFISPDGNQKIWWPIKNGPFAPSFARLKAPYYPDYQQLDRETSRVWQIAQVALAAGMVALDLRTTYMAAQAAITVKQLLQNADAVNHALQAGYVANQVMAPFVIQEHRANDQLQARAVREYITQKEVLDTLEQQDVYDRGEEVVKAVALGDLNLVQELMQGGPIPFELRCQALVLAAGSGYGKIVKKLLEGIDMDARIVQAAQKAAKENDYNSVVTILREYQVRDRPVPR